MVIDFETLKQQAATDTRTVTSGQIRWLVAEVERLRAEVEDVKDANGRLQADLLFDIRDPDLWVILKRERDEAIEHADRLADELNQIEKAFGQEDNL